MKVSIIIPVYNSEAFLNETMQSVVSQDYRDIEIVLVDDGSTDGSRQLCEEWAEKDSRVLVFHIDNSGPSIARNYAIERATGEFILPVDSDDIIAENYVSLAVNVLSSDCNIGIVYCKAELFGEESGEWLIRPYSIQEMLICNCIFATAMFRRKDWVLTGGYCEDMRNGLEDYDFWLSILELGRKVVCIPKTLFYYRKRTGSRTDIFESSIETVNRTDRIKYIRHKKLFMRYFNIPPEGENFVLYGAGGAGKTYYEFIETLGMRQNVLWVDKNFKEIMKGSREIIVNSPQRILDWAYYGVYIAINNIEIMKKVFQSLVELGIDDKKIYWYLTNVEEL